MYKQERRTRFWQRMCNAYAKRMTQQSDPTISKHMGRLGLMRRRRWRTLKNRCVCKYLTILLSSDAEEGWRRGKAWAKWANQRRHTQKAQHMPLVSEWFNISDTVKKLYYGKSNSASEIAVCVLLCFIKPILGNHYIRSWGFIMSEPVM